MGAARFTLAFCAALATCVAASYDTCADRYYEGQAAARESRHAEAERIFGEAVNCAESLGEDQLLANALTELAIARQEQGRQAEAVPAFEQALKIFDQGSPARSAHVASALNNLASARQALGNLAEVEKLYLRALEIWRSLPGEVQGTTRTLDNLSSIAIARGEYARAEALLREALTTSNVHPASIEHVNVLNRLGVLYDKLGRPEAEQMLREALRLREAVDSTDHTDISVVSSNLGHVLETQGRYEEAESMLRQAIANCSKSMATAGSCATMLNNLASLEEKTGRVQEAELQWRAVIDSYGTAQLGNATPLAAALNNLAKLYVTRRQFKDAEPLYDRALSIWDNAYGPGSPDRASILTNLGALRMELGKLPQAEDFFAQALAVDERAMGPDHWRVAIDCNNLAVLSIKRKRYDQAEALFERALKINERTFGTNSGKIAGQLANMAELSYSRKHYAKAAEQYGRAFANWGEKTGLPPATEANLLEHYSLTLKQLQEFAQAEKAASRAMNLRVKLALGKTAQAMF